MAPSDTKALFITFVYWKMMNKMANLQTHSFFKKNK